MILININEIRNEIFRICLRQSNNLLDQFNLIILRIISEKVLKKD